MSLDAQYLLVCVSIMEQLLVIIAVPLGTSDYVL
jgi:hypothetical protein